MGNIYFGASVPVYPHNGNWQDINQWYSYPGYDSSKSGEASVLLGRFPDPATDKIHCYQYIKSNVGVYNTGTSTWTTDGIWPGEMLSVLADGTGIFTGVVATGAYSYIIGNSSNTLPELRGLISTGGITATGGLISANISTGATLSLSRGVKITSTFANVASRIEINGASTYNPIRTEQLFLRDGANVANGIIKCSFLLTQGNNITVYSDISTANTGGCLRYEIAGGAFLNTNPWIFGNTTHAATVTIAPTTTSSYFTYDTTYDKPITIYGRTSSVTYFGVNSPYSTPPNTIFNGLITFIPITGQANSGRILVHNGTYSPNVFINLSSYGVSTNTKIANTSLPDDLTFLQYGKFEPKVKLLNVSPGVDVISTQIR